MAAFYVCTGDAAAEGPITLDELALRRGEGSVVDASLVWSESDLTPSSEWLPLATCTALLAALEASIVVGGDPESEGEVEASPRLGRVVIAAFDYEGNEADGEISFTKGDRIQMTVDPSGIDDGWWSGLHELSGAMGLFPANYVVEESAAEAVANLDADDLTADSVAAISGADAAGAAAPSEASVPDGADDGPPAKARSAHVMEEIAMTERRYVSDVTLLRDTFVNPIVNTRAGSPTGSDVSSIGAIVVKHDSANGGALLALFAQVEAMANLNAEFLVELDRRKAERPNAELAPIDVCAAFDAYLPFFKLYAPYMNGFKAAMDSLDGLMTGRSKKEFIAFCEPRGGTSKFTSLLIKPVQRIPRYRLLLEELRKQHGKERAKAAEAQGAAYAEAEADAAVDAALAKTIDVVKSIAAQCNAGVEEHAARQVVLQLHRRFTGIKVSLVPSRKLVRQVNSFFISFVCYSFVYSSILFVNSSILLFPLSARPPGRRVQDEPKGRPRHAPRHPLQRHVRPRPPVVEEHERGARRAPSDPADNVPRHGDDTPTDRVQRPQRSEVRSPPRARRGDVLDVGRLAPRRDRARASERRLSGRARAQRAREHGVADGGELGRLLRADLGGECSFMYRYISRESCSQFDSLPLTSLTVMHLQVDTDSKTCTVCHETFGRFSRRRHHCRKCGCLVCHECSGKTWRMPPKNEKQRVCDPCYADLRAPFVAASQEFRLPPKLPPLPAKAEKAHKGSRGPAVTPRSARTRTAGAALLSRGLAETAPRAGGGAGGGAGDESDGSDDGVEEVEGDTFDGDFGSAKKLGAFESLAEVRGERARGSVVTRTTAEAEAMRKRLQQRLQKKNSKSQVIRGSDRARVRTAFSAERGEFAPIDARASARASAVAASPGADAGAPPALPRRDGAYRKLVRRVLAVEADAEEEGAGGVAATADGGDADASAADASAADSPAAEGGAPRRRRLSLTVHAALVAASQRRSSLAAIASPVAAAPGDGSGEGAAVERAADSPSVEDAEPTRRRKTPEPEEEGVEEEAAALSGAEGESSAGKKKKKKKKKMVVGEIGPPPSATGDGTPLVKEKKKKKKKKSEVPAGLRGKPKLKAPKVVEM